MTREEAKDALFAFVPSGWSMTNVNFISTIDEIYDDFELKTCNNCKYALAEDGDAEGDIYRCEYLYDDIGNIGYFPNDFGCNKWESKCQ